jgi:hypothetical protein
MFLLVQRVLQADRLSVPAGRQERHCHRDLGDKQAFKVYFALLKLASRVPWGEDVKVRFIPDSSAQEEFWRQNC